MNLIEQLGGYEAAKIILDDIKNRNHKYAKNFEKPALESALLEYRREHGIYEKDDIIVFDTNKPFCASMQSDLMKIINPCYQEFDMIVMIDNQMYQVGGKAVRHATPLEIQAGHRLP